MRPVEDLAASSARVWLRVALDGQLHEALPEREAGFVVLGGAPPFAERRQHVAVLVPWPRRLVQQTTRSPSPTSTACTPLGRRQLVVAQLVTQQVCLVLPG